MKKIYIASPFTDKDDVVQKLRYQAICKITVELIRQYPRPNYSFYSPIAHSYGLYIHGGLDGDSEFWLEQDFPFIDWADELWVADIEGKLTSDGIKAEIEYAIKKGKKVRWL